MKGKRRWRGEGEGLEGKGRGQEFERRRANAGGVVREKGGSMGGMEKRAFRREKKEEGRKEETVRWSRKLILRSGGGEEVRRGTGELAKGVKIRKNNVETERPNKKKGERRERGRRS